MNTARQFRAIKHPLYLNHIDLHFFQRTQDGKIAVADPTPMTFHDPAAIEGFQAPMLTISPDEAQGLMDELWRAGIRPTEGAGSVGQLAATERHLEDMRTLVFKPQAA